MSGVMQIYCIAPMMYGSLSEIFGYLMRFGMEVF